MKNIILLLLATVCSGGAIAQISNCTAIKNMNVDRRITESVNSYNSSATENLSNAQGSQFTSETFTLGNIYENDVLVLKNVPLRYNSYADQIELQQIAGEENSGLLVKDAKFFVKMNNEDYIFIPDNNSYEESGYFKIVTSGDHFDLYKKSVTTYIAAREAKTTYETSQPAKFVTEVSYFLMSKDGKLGKLPTNRNRVAKALTGKTKEVKKFIDNNKLDLDKDTDMAKLVIYYDSII